MPTSTAATTLAIPSVVVPQHDVILLDAGICLCSLGMRYLTVKLVECSRVYFLESGSGSLTPLRGVGKCSHFK